MFEAVAGGAAAAETVGRWSGRALDPAIAAVFLDSPAELLRMCGPDDLWAAVVDAEPEPRRVFADEAALEEALAGFGDAADLKSPWFTGHSRGVAGLARAAAERLRPDGASLVYRAGLVHDLGRVAVSGRRMGAAGPAACRGLGAGAAAPVPYRPDPGALAGARAARPGSQPSSRTAGRDGLPGRGPRVRAGRGRLPARRGRRAARAE